jgi:ADP-heptose:LPS heptosyltransferase
MLQDGWQPVLGGTAADAQTFAQHQHLFPTDCVNLMGQDSLPGYMQRIAAAAGLVASGTGPLHLAAILGKPCVGLFPPKPSVNQSRWGAIGPASTNLQLPGPCESACSNQDCACMRAIEPQQVWQALQNQLTIQRAAQAAS